MKFVKPLSEKQKQDLEHAHKQHSQHRVRLRSQAVLLSARGYTLKQLAALYEVKRDTVSAWLDSWEVGGIKGIEDEVRPGRPPILNEENRMQFKVLLVENPHQLKSSVARFEEQTGILASLKTYRRTAKKF